MEDIQLHIEALEAKIEDSSLTMAEYQEIKHEIEQLKLCMLQY